MGESPPQGTKSGDFEAIEYRMFQAVTYDRVMRWRGGSGRIAFGGTSYNTNTDNTRGTILRAGQTVAVLDTTFRLSQA
ncbi:hypothetical protein K491DRAFT_697087 [Lophiostoma macrostomum CBS 122681]|uniref:Uncharacterized protein n=1 Tax=Lophiostoma macrostomum CBS 122681 TaxID=1314788 RepID=A0A6A6SSD8_9PLEO|nr:hypothetical protein K491DRAFT_697087 [Lophiostoma macrostomum CBS 122681]